MYNNARRWIVSVRDFTSYIILACSALIAFLVIIFSGQPIYHIFSIWAITAVAVVISKFDFFHPFFWFSLFFTLYSTANAILYCAGIERGNYSKEQILYPAVSLVLVLFTVGPKKIEKRKIGMHQISEANSLLSNAIIILAMLTVLFSIILRVRGYSSKVQMREEGDIYFRLGVHIVRFLTLFTLLYVADLLNNKKGGWWSYIIVAGIAALTFTLFTGERDVVFRYGYAILTLLFFHSIIKPRHLILIFPIAILAMVISVVIKYYFLRGDLNAGSGNLLYDFLTSDFSAAGRNLQYLLDRDWTRGHLGFRTLFTEVFNPILIGVEAINPDRWFNYEVHTGTFKGYAFTLVGTGYAIGGLAGIVLVFLVVAFIVKIFYRKSSTSTYWLAAYIYLSSTVIFSFRQSLQSITNSLVKHVGFGIVICLILSRYKIVVRKGSLWSQYKRKGK